MKRALSIAWKDTRHVYRNFAGLAMMLLAPLVLAFALGSAFGSGDNFSISAVNTIVVDQDAGAGAGTPAAGATLTSALTSPELAKLIKVTQMQDPQGARKAVDSGDAQAAVIIPQNLSQALMGSGADRADVEIYKDPSVSIGPSIVSAVVQSVMESLNGARAAAATAAQLAVRQGVDSGRLAEIAANTAKAFSEQAQSQPAISTEERAPAVSGAENRKPPNVASQVLLGMMLFFMLFGAATPARSVIDEHRNGTLPRLFTTPTPRSTILGGKYIAVFLVVLAQAVILLVAGRLFLGARWGSFGPVAALTIVGALVAASLGLVTVSFAKTPGQAGAVSSAIFVFLGLISGNFVGTANLGPAFAAVRRISPLGWLLEGWSNVLYGGSWASVWLPLLAALAFALVFFALATFFFRRRYA